MKNWFKNIKNKIIQILTTPSNKRYEFTISETYPENIKEGNFSRFY